ncbi:MAG: ATP-binding protein, partial [Candidatus Andersenbacteria bacterium]
PSLEGLTIYLNDITRYKVIEQEQERSQELLTAVIEGTSDAVYVKDLEGRYLLINEAGARLLGRSTAEVLDHKDNEIFTADTAEKIKAGEAKVIESGQQLTYEDVGTAAGQTRTYLSSKGPLRDHRGEIIGVVGISSDITERKKFELRKDEFIGIASHELKTPLTSLRLFISILEKALAQYPDPAVKNYVSKIKLQTDRLTRLVADLLDISKIRAGKLEFRTTTFNLNEVLAEVVEVMQANTKRHVITLTSQLSRPINGDPERIGQVFINVLSNAIKYSPQANQINVTITATPQEAVISVRDFGIGINATARAKIFDRFYQVADAENPSQPGLGMGLYIAHEIVRRHSGSIEVESQSGVGSTFVVKLPIAYAHAEVSNQSAHR